MCCITGAVAAYALEKEDTVSVVKVFIRHFCKYGYAKFIYYDLSSAFVGAVKIKMDCRDLEARLSRMGVEAIAKATGAHQEHGKVERTVRAVREIFAQQSVKQLKQSLLSWETTLASVANFINNLPMARLSGATNSTREIDILTRNRLLLGRNNYRSPDGDFFVPGQPAQRLDQIKEINGFFYRKLMENISEFIDYPKWYDSDKDVEEGDVVIFMSEEKDMAIVWTIGMVDSRESAPTMPGKWKIRYYNASEAFARFTVRSSRELVVIHSVLDLDYNSEEHRRVIKSLFTCRAQTY